ncbi:MAG: ATP-binding protein [Fibrobacter sp.]|nr:ATP-binding protein [Fibrobacter sp.]
MKRKILQKLISWKDKKKRKPLVVTGVRQCGKTYTIREFGNTCFDSFAYFNFEGNQGLQSIFRYDFNVKRILTELELFSGQKIVVGKTLVFFDEIQACPEAITCLKYFCENMPELHVVAAGSLLGVVMRQSAISFPVGKVERLQMFPMSFDEFLMAFSEGDTLLEGIANYDLTRPLPELYTVPLQKYLKYYYVVGGMPEAVSCFVEENNFEKVNEILNNILKDYSDDFSKHAPTTDVPKLGLIWDSVPKQLAKENNKFVFSHVKAGKRAADLEDALQWLFNAGLLHKLECVNQAEIPLANNADGSLFKVYMCDVGLLRAKTGIDPKTVLEDSPIYATFKGAFTENFVLNELLKNEIHPYFWRSGNTAELDFLFEIKNEIYPVEVKADVHTKSKSYNVFCKKYSPKKGFVLSQKNIAITNDGDVETVHWPLYLSGRIF